MIKAVIIDDEESAIANLKFDIEQYLNKKIKLLGSTTDFVEGVILIKEYKPELIFLDIDLGNKKTGFDLLKEIKAMELSRIPEVIFTTGFNQFAIKAIKEQAFDYLVKPIDPDELTDAIERLENHLHNHQTQVHKASRAKDTLSLSTQEKIHIIKLENIIRCQSERNYTKFFISESKTILVSKTLGEYDKLLCSKPSFYRPHKSHIINLKHVKSYSKQDGGYLQMNDGSEVPVAQSKKEELLSLF